VAHTSERVPPDFQGTYSYFPSLSKPVIAAINGHAVGLGLVIALYCDIRFASTEAKLSTAFARRGLIAEFGTAWMLPRLIGLSNALDLLLSARTVGAAEALRMGLVNRVFPVDTFVEDVRAYARELATQVSPRSMAAIKQLVYRAMFQTLEEACFKYLRRTGVGSVSAEKPRFAALLLPLVLRAALASPAWYP
jgi:enoyl-CoA hydratase/carnithine racemase